VRLAEIEAELRSIHEAAGDAALTEEQQTTWDTLVAERGQVEAAIARDDERRAVVRSLADRPGHTENVDPVAPEVMRKVEPFDGSDVRALPRHQARDKARKVLESREHTDHMTDEQRAHVDRLLRTESKNFDGTKLARLLLASENPHYHTAFRQILGGAALLSSEEAAALRQFNELRTAMSLTDAAGGYGVPVNTRAA
jgi:hypothetical protein